jgi:uncharacterized protein (TIGR03435 family)
MKLFVCLAAALSIAALAVRAQSLPAGAPAFDVVSVKKNTSGGPMLQRNTPGNIAMFNVPVRQLIRMAYQLQDFQIVGTPDWADKDRFDIEGRFESPPPGPPQPTPRMLLMLRTLLRDRFGMVAQMETREMPILVLRIARADGRLGPQIKPSEIDCAALNAAARGRGPGGPAAGGRAGAPPIDGRGAPPPPGTPFSLGERPACGDRMAFGQLLAGGMPISRLATQLLPQLTGRVVVDRTGLTGGYDIDLKWTPTPDQLPPGPPPPGVEPPPIDPTGPSLFTALQEQLGLKLDTERGPIDVLVVDRLQQPAEN